jgi:4'-phosphopantetheinyl transferase
METDKQNDIDAYNTLYSLLPFEKQQAISSFRFDADKKLKICSEILIRCLICQTLHIKNKEIQFLLNDYGKPYLAYFPSFEYNISHTKNAIAIGISDNPVGVDIEKIKRFDFRMPKYSFTDNENSFLTSEQANQDRRFFEIWTKKEAYIKYSGKGLSIPLKSFDVTDTGFSPNLSSVQISDYIISVCGTGFLDKELIKEISEQELLKMGLRHFE